MSRSTESFQLDLSSGDAELACKQAIASVGWGINSAGPSRIEPRIGLGISRNPSKIEVLIEGNAPATITLNGQIFGVAPLQKRHLAAEMNKLRNAIEVAEQALR